MTVFREGGDINFRLRSVIHSFTLTAHQSPMFTSRLCIKETSFVGKNGYRGPISGVGLIFSVTPCLEQNSEPNSVKNTLHTTTFCCSGSIPFISLGMINISTIGATSNRTFV